MSFYPALAVMQLRPPVNGQAERDCGGIKGKHLVTDEELLQPVTFPAGNVNEPVCIFLEYFDLTNLVHFAEITTRHALAETKAVELGTMGVQGNNQVTHTLAI